MIEEACDRISPGADELLLLSEFPPVETADWENAIAADLQGADYKKKLMWKTEEGIDVRPYYRSSDAPGEFAWRRATAEWQTLSLPPAGELVDAVAFHEAGGTAVQELAYAMAAGSDRLAGGKAVPGFVFGIGSNYFFQIAKLRAARSVWARVSEAYGKPADAKIYAVTGLFNKSIYDPYVNLLRATTEALSAVIGGCDGLMVQAVGFTEHLAANLQLVLKEEAHLDKVADPAGGSYYVETLTDALSREAWLLFQQIEAEGGYTRVKATGALDTAIAASRAAKEKAIASRRRTMVGVNNYPDTRETALDIPNPLARVEGRLACTIENIRLRTERHARKTGAPPKILLLKRGDLKMKMARATFCRNFFGCAGLAIEESESLEGANPALIVLCSSDPEYLEFARHICPKTKVPVIVAGNPKEFVEDLRAAGVVGFVHAQSDMVDTLREWQDRLGFDGKEAR